MSFGRLDTRGPILAFAVLAAALATSAGRADAASTVTIQHRTLAIAGDAADDRVAIAAAGGPPGTVHVTGLAATVGITHAEAVDELAVHTLGGDDSVDSSGQAAGTIGLTSD